MGHSLNYHYKRINSYLEEHDEIDLNNLFDFYYMDEGTNPKHAISGLFTEMAFEKGGLELVKKMLALGTDYPDLTYKKRYYKVIEDILGIKQSSFNKVIRLELKKRAEG